MYVTELEIEINNKISDKISYHDCHLIMNIIVCKDHRKNV
jgi:hypothetical protein